MRFKKLIILLLIACMVFPATSTAAIRNATLVNSSGKKVKVTVGSASSKYYFSKGYKLMVKSGKIGFAVATDYSSNLLYTQSAAATTLTPISLYTKSGSILSTATLGNKIFLMVDYGKSSEEIEMCTTISAPSFTNCIRGLDFSGTSETGSTTLAKIHNSGATIAITNVHYVYQQYVDNTSNQTIGGNKTFIGYLHGIDPTGSSDITALATVNYVNQTATSGAPNASSLIKGISQLATAAQAASSTTLGSTGASLVVPSSITSSDGTSPSITADQSQLTQNNYYVVGYNAAQQVLAQSFVPTQAGLSKIVLYNSGNYSGITGNIVIEIRPDSAGSPATTSTAIASTTMTLAQWSSNPGAITFSFSDRTLSIGSTYWIVMRSSSNTETTGSYKFGVNTSGGSYANGTLKYSQNYGASWGDLGNDAYFATYGYASAAVVPVTNGNGLLNPVFYQSNNNTWTGTNNYSASTTMASTSVANLIINGVGANALVGSASTLLHNHPSVVGTYATTTIANGTQQIVTHGLGIIPKKIFINAILNSSVAQPIFSNGMSDGTNMAITTCWTSGNPGTTCGGTGSYIIAISAQTNGNIASGVTATISNITATTFKLTWAVGASQNIFFSYEVE